MVKQQTNKNKYIPKPLEDAGFSKPKRVSTKALIEENSYSIVEINNAGGDPLSACPMGAKLENQFSVAVLDKGVTITCVLRLALISQLNSETASSSGLGISVLMFS